MDKEFFDGMNLASDISDEDFQIILDSYESIKDKISKEEFINKFNERREEYGENYLMGDVTIVRWIASNLGDEKNVKHSEVDSGNVVKIADVEDGNQGFTIVARVMGISNIKSFTTGKGKSGQLCNVEVADDSERLRLVFWSQNIKHLKDIKEGDVVKFTDVSCKTNSYNGNKELSLQVRSSVRVLSEFDVDYPENIGSFPVYNEIITQIKDIVPDEEVSIHGKLIRVPTPHSYESKGKKGKVVSLEVQDQTGKISYTLWNKDVELIDDLGLEEGDYVKILKEQARERNGEISLSHWNGRICKTDETIDLPDIEEEIFKIGDAREVKDITVYGIVTKVMDTVNFTKKDGTPGFVKSIEIADETGTIRLTLWGEDTQLDISKGDMIKVLGGNIEYDDYTLSGYRVNTNWNTEIKINPEDDSGFKESLEKEYITKLGPIAIKEIQEIDDEGEEVDIFARLISLTDIREFQRDDGSLGMVRSGDFADGSGEMIRVSFWDDKAEYPFTIGNAYKIENAKIRLGTYAVELNVNKTTRFIEVPESQAESLPSLHELEELIYQTKKIQDLDEDDVNIKVLARIIDIQDIRQFENDGKPGVVRSMDIADSTGVIRASFWGEMASLPCDVGDAIKIQNPNVRFNENTSSIELSINNSTTVLDPSAEELKTIPNVSELEESLFVYKDISNLEDGDTYVKIRGDLTNINTDNIISFRCSHCRERIELDEKVCPNCNEEIIIPDALLILSGTINDGTGEIDVTFFNRLAEELLEMRKEDIIEVLLDSNDTSIFAHELEGLNGLHLEILTDVEYDLNTDQYRLRPKRIISKSF